MNRGTFVYKCRSCRKKFSPITYPDAMKAAVCAVNEGERMFYIHNCKSGDMGIGDLIAIEPDNKSERKRIYKFAR